MISAGLDTRSVNSSEQSRWTEQTTQSAKAPTPDTQIENSPESPSVDFYVWNLAIVIKAKLALYSLRTYKSDLDWGQICPRFPPHVVDRRCYMLF